MRGRLIAGLGVLVVLLAAAPAQAKTDPLERYARGTWASMVAMTDEHTGLPADFVNQDGTRSTPTSPTNIGAYLWSTVAAERLGIIGHREAVARLGQTVGTLETMERGNAGQYFNWYDIRDGSVSPTSPGGGDATPPILSSVDNGWLATGLRVVASRVPELRARAQALLGSMDFGFYYRPAENRILFHYVPSTGEAVCCYDTTVSESRIATYVGIEQGEIPARQYYGTNRAFPDSCDWSWTETRPLGPTRSYLGETVFEGALPYAGTRVTPSWGGSMFEALMPTLFVPEERWAPGSWGVNHPLWVRAQIHHGLAEARYGYWGFSPSNTPEGGYGTYGVDAIGSNPEGYPSNEDATLVDHGFPGCPDRPAKPDPPPSAYTNGVVTPHAAFLALRYAPRDALANLRRLERDFPGLYGRWGFRDSVNVDTGHVSDFYLSLDQGMAMAALGNALGGDVLRRAFATQRTKRALRPVIGVEEFGATPRGCTITGTPGPDRLRGTRKADVICGLGGDDRIDGRGGADAIFGDAGNDRLKGGDGGDSLYGDEGDDDLAGGRGDDVVSGGPGVDRLSGEAEEQGG